MAVTNLAIAKHKDGRPVAVEDIRVGVVLAFPSGVGGVVDCKCVSKDSEVACFNSINKDWPLTFRMNFNAPDFTLEDFKALSDALVAYVKWNTQPTSEQRAIVQRAHALGYARSISYTQAEWTDEGINAYNAVM